MFIETTYTYIIQNKGLSGEIDPILKLVNALFDVYIHFLAGVTKGIANGSTVAFSKGSPGYFARQWRP